MRSLTGRAILDGTVDAPYRTEGQIMQPNPLNAAQAVVRDAADLECSLLDRYWRLDPEYRDVVALWSFATWVYERYPACGYLLISSDRQGAGKSDLCRFLTFVCKDAAQDLQPTAPAVYAAKDSGCTTVIVDQADKLLARMSPDLESTILGGYNRGGGKVTRGFTGKKGKRGRVTFDPYFPKAFAGIRLERKIRPELEERSLLVISRKVSSPPPDWLTFEPQVIASDVPKISAALGFMLGYDTNTQPRMPSKMVGRRRQIWTPLFSVAEFLDGDWPKRCERAAKRIEGERRRLMVDETVGVLIDLRAIFDERFPGSSNPRDFLSRRELCDAHADIDAHYFGRAFSTPNALHRFMFQEFGVEGSKPSGGSPRGYFRRDLIPAWTEFQDEMRP